MFGRKLNGGRARDAGKAKQTTAFAPRRSAIHPFWALVCFAAAALAVLSYIGYRPGQPVLFPAWLANSAGQNPNPPPSNPVGLLGATIAAMSNSLTGYPGLFFVPVYLVWMGYLFGFRRAHALRPWRILLMLITLLAATGLAAWLGNLAHLGYNQQVFPHGNGGLAGDILFNQLLRNSLGNAGSAVVLGLVYLLGLTFVFVDEPGRTLEGLLHSFAGWRQKRAEAARKRREDLAKQKAAAQAAAAALAAPTSPAGAAAPGKTAVAPKETPEGRGHGTFKLGETESQMTKPAEEQEDHAAAKEATPAEGFAPAPPGATKVRLGRGAREEKVDAMPPPVSGLRIIEEEKVEKAAPMLPQRKGDFIFPTLDLLGSSPQRPTDTAEYHQERAAQIVRTLAEFGVQVRGEEIHAGPVITRYEVSPAAGVRVEKIVNLDKNLALSLKAEGVRIIAPVPGKGTVGIEVPNRQPAVVCLRDIIESKAWAESKADIPVVLGKDVTGKAIVTDLTKMPHALIAGATGSGKTVCINAIIASLLYKMSPDDLRFIMVDPKIVEMQVYNDLPHMLVPVVTDPKKVPAALKYLIREMERRYQLFARVGARNIAGFNAKIHPDQEQQEKAEELEADLSPEERAATRNLVVPRDADVEIERKKLPYIVCIIDELADLMMVAPADIETCVARLAQLARAAGIHLILATQRPSVNVITGVIKANLPCRIAFKVASKVDSRTILDMSGADALIGRGDMLFVPPGAANLVRAQGALVSDDEINGLVEFLKRNGPPEYAEDVQAQIETADLGEGEEGEAEDAADSADEQLVRDAIEVLRATKRASTSMLQRRLKIGYNRAARIMELLEERGIVGPENGPLPREILKDLESL
jgi:DNA segregation ATPase FtsK/SpoIIIE, S-DNA-T family